MMQFHRRRWFISGIVLTLALSVGWPVCAEQQPTETVAVAKTYNDAPFDYHIRLSAQRPQFRVYHVTYPSPVVTAVVQNNTVPADYYLPNGIKPGDAKRPAVICLHILDGNEPLTDLMCSVLAGRGDSGHRVQVALLRPARAGEGARSFGRTIPRCSSARSSRRARIFGGRSTCLASRPEIDADRIGITGISLGGIIAATAAGAEPRLHRAGLILSGGDLLTIIYHARETRPLAAMLQKLPEADRKEIEAKIAARDPLRFADGLRDTAREGRVLMLNAAEDEVIPRVCTEKLAQAIGISDRVVWFEGVGHYTAMANLPRALRMTADFFAQDLPPGAQPPAAPPAAKRTPLAQFTTLLEQAMAILSTEPAEGRCHVAALELSLAGRHLIEARLRFVRGPKGKFLLQGKLPEVGEVAMGQGRFPWLLAGGKTVLAGTKNPSDDHDPLRFVDPQNLTKLRVAGGLVGVVVMAPDTLRQWIAIEEDKAATGGRDSDGAAVQLPPQRMPPQQAGGIRITAKDGKKMPGEIRLKFEDDGRTPAEAVFDIAGVRGTLRFRGWQTNGVSNDAMFEPPEAITRRRSSNRTCIECLRRRSTSASIGPTEAAGPRRI